MYLNRGYYKPKKPKTDVFVCVCVCLCLCVDMYAVYVQVALRFLAGNSVR